MKIDVKLVKCLGQGEALVELNTGEVVEVFYDPCHYENEDEDDVVYVDDITGTIGEWLDKDTSDIPNEAMEALKKAYSICVNSLTAE